MPEARAYKIRITRSWKTSACDFAKFIKEYIEPTNPGTSCEKHPNWDPESDPLSFTIWACDDHFTSALRKMDSLSQKAAQFLSHQIPRALLQLDQSTPSTLAVNGPDGCYFIFEILDLPVQLPDITGKLVAKPSSDGKSINIKLWQPDGSYKTLVSASINEDPENPAEVNLDIFKYTAMPLQINLRNI